MTATTEQPFLVRHSAPLSLIVGFICAWIHHHMAGFLGDMQLPSWYGSAVRMNRALMTPLIDVLLFALPVVLFFTVLAASWCFAIKGGRPRDLLFALFGWALPAIGIMVFGQISGKWDVIAQFVKWPHTILVHFSPALGLATGWVIVRGRNRALDRRTA